MKNLYSLSLAFVLAIAACGGQKPHSDRTKLLSVGTEVPALVRVDHRGEVVSLRSEQPTLLYFYPKDGTPGCTKEACAFRDAWDRYADAGLRVVGVSIDSEQRHREFADEYELPFSLIADPEHTWSDAFGVGRFMGSADERGSFLIDGKVPTPMELNPLVPEQLSNLVMECVRTNAAKRPHGSPLDLDAGRRPVPVRGCRRWYRPTGSPCRHTGPVAALRPRFVSDGRVHGPAFRDDRRQRRVLHPAGLGARLAIVWLRTKLNR